VVPSGECFGKILQRDVCAVKSAQRETDRNRTAFRY